MRVWETHLDERQLKEIAFCRVYKDGFAHGTDGHNIRLIVAKLAELLDMGVIPPKQEAWDLNRPAVPNKPATLKD